MKKKNENDYLSLKIVILIIVAFIVGLSEIFIEKNIVTGVFFYDLWSCGAEPCDSGKKE